MVTNLNPEMYQIRYGRPLPLGITKEKNTIYFSVAIEEDNGCYLNIYRKGDIKKLLCVELTKEYKTGNIYAVAIDNLPNTELEYMYEVMGHEFIDPQAPKISGRESFGKYIQPKDKKLIRGEIVFPKFDWKEDVSPQTEYKDLIIYRLHPRGFTKHSSSQVRHKGTFKGITEKIAYLKELGINAIELMPCYEFNEIVETKATPFGYSGYKEFLRQEKLDLKPDYKVNYWGYTRDACYYAPKTSYAATKNPINELKELIRTCHKENIEVYMEFFFHDQINPMFVSECLRFWVREYHIDGFRFNSEAVPVKYLGTDPYLGRVKLMCTNWNTYDLYKEKSPRFKNLAEYNDGFQNDIRRFLKGDEEMTSRFSMQFKCNPAKIAKVNYITNTNGFTLADLYSYDVKHNEKNEEDNHDGTDYNYSWNCGKEGKTKSKKVLELRHKQMRNAFTTLLLSQGTPLILAGDEFGNSQNGNNNAYCQDNELSYLNWHLLKNNEGLFKYVKWLIALRKKHPILHMGEEFKVMDYISCGYPDLSFHGTKAWYPDYSNYSRVLGIMLCGKYVKVDRINNDKYFYFAYNMHWEPHNFDLPNLPEGSEWSVLIDTSEEYEQIVNEEVMSEKVKKQLANKRLLLKPRSIVVLVSTS